MAESAEPASKRRRSCAFDFEGKRALVTGAGKGIGAAIARALHDAGAHVAAISRTPADLAELEAALGGERVATVAVDLADSQALEAALQTCLEKMGGVDFLVNNAGVALASPLLDTPLADFRTTMQVNLEAAFLCTQVAGRKMVEQGAGAIVNVSSQAGLVATPNLAAYSCSKAAMDMLTKMTSLELGEKGVRCNSVNPTVVMTRMGRAAWSDPARGQAMLDRIPMSRFAEVDEVVEPVLFLLSDAAGMINGTVTPIDGGLTTACTLRTAALKP